MLYPIVGIRDLSVTEILRRTLPKLPTQTSEFAATACMNIGLVEGEEPRAWIFSTEADPDSTIADMVEVISRVGVPFMEPLARGGQAIERLVREQSLQADVVLPALMLGQGKPDAAVRHVQSVLESLPEHGVWRDFYEKFAAKVIAEAAGDD